MTFMSPVKMKLSTLYNSIVSLTKRPHTKQTERFFPILVNEGALNRTRNCMVLVQYTMHLFDDETCLKILRNCKKALSNSNGKLLIYDPIIPSVTDGNESPYKDVSPEMDLLLLVHAGGVDRTEEQWRTLLANGGFANVRILHFPPQHWLIEACQ